MKDDIANFVKRADCDEKLKNLDWKVTLNEGKRVMVPNELNKLSEKVKLISTKELTYG